MADKRLTDCGRERHRGLLAAGDPAGEVRMTGQKSCARSTTTTGADQAPLVAWGGLTKQAQQAVAGQQFKIRVWTADELIDALGATYSQLSEELRDELPLKQVWTVVEEGVPYGSTTE